MEVENEIYQAYIDILESKAKSGDLARLIIGFCIPKVDFELSIKLCKYFIDNNDPDVKAAVIHSLGYIACNYKEIDHDFTQKVLKKYYKSSNCSISGAVEDAIDDIEHNVKNFKFDSFSKI